MNDLLEAMGSAAMMILLLAVMLSFMIVPVFIVTGIMVLLGVEPSLPVYIVMITAGAFGFFTFLEYF